MRALASKLDAFTQPVILKMSAVILKITALILKMSLVILKMSVVISKMTQARIDLPPS